MKKEKKTEVIRLRVTVKEKEIILGKAEGYPSLSSYLFDAAINYDSKYSVKLFDNLNQWTEYLDSWKVFYQKLGGNINQLAKYENSLAKAGILSPDVASENIRLKQECVDFLSKIVEFQSFIRRNMKYTIK